MNTEVYASRHERIKWIDIAKGLTILLVIVGHTVEGTARGLIFSFHMPLFFILSMITYNLSKDNDSFVRKTEKAFRHLMLPTIGIMCLKFATEGIQNRASFDLNTFLALSINRLVYSSGVNVAVMGEVIPKIGSPWFLVALFIGRTLFDYLHLKLSKKAFVCVICGLTMAGVLLGRIQWLPLSTDISFAVMVFLYIGMRLKDVDINRHVWFIAAASGVLWIASFAICLVVKNGYMEMALRRYTLFPICFIAAFAGTMLVASISIIVERIAIIKPLEYLGKNSLYLLCVHSVDPMFRFIWGRTGNVAVNTIIRLVLNVGLFLIFVKVIEFVKSRKRMSQSASIIS